MADDLRDDEATKDRNFVTALARGLELLSCFRDGEVTLTNSDFSDRTGLPKATISRLTYTLCELGYLIADLRTGTYRLGAAALNLGFSVLSGIDIQDLAQKEMAQLRDGPNSYITVALGEVYQLEVVYVATSNSLEIGQSILVGMRDDAREAVFEYAGRQGAEIEAEGRKRYAEAKSIYESKGFCTGYGIWRKDVNGIAAPVFSMSGDRVYGLNLGGPSFRVKPKQLESVYAPRLIKAANALSMHPHR
jgi:DNA-binding IclR family transcriptional regulator